MSRRSFVIRSCVATWVILIPCAMPGSAPAQPPAKKKDAIEQSVDRELERVAYTLGHSVVRTFLRVTVPLAFPALLSGAVMAWARALILSRCSLSAEVIALVLQNVCRSR